MRSTGSWKWALLMLGGILAAALHAGSWPGTDPAWFLYAGREVAHGARYGVDVADLNPPLILWLEAPVVWLAERLGMALWPTWVGFVTLTALGCTLLAQRLLPANTRTVFRALPGAGVVVGAVLLLPGWDFGQREHVAFLLLLPYLAWGARRWAGGKTSLPAGLAVGLLGALGIGLKPFYILVPVGLAAPLLSRQGLGKTLARPEHLALAGTGLFYLAGVLLLTPEYLEYVATYGALYGEYLRMPFYVAAIRGEGVAPAYVALAAWFVLRRQVSAGEARYLGDSLAVGTIGLQLAAILQEKGWGYHFLPAILSAALLGAVLVTSLGPRLVLKVNRAYYAVASGLLVWLATGALVPPLIQLSGRRHLAPGDPSLELLLPVVEAAASSGSVAVLSTSNGSAFPLVLEANASWALRRPHPWPLVPIYGDQVELRDHLVTPHRWESWSRPERQLAFEILEDLERAEPVLLLVLLPDPGEEGWGLARRFGYLAWLSQVPGFTEGTMGRYRRAGVVGTYEVHLRIGARVDLPQPEHQRQRLNLELRARQRVGRWTSIVLLMGFLIGAVAGWRATRARATTKRAPE